MLPFAWPHRKVRVGFGLWGTYLPPYVAPSCLTCGPSIASNPEMLTFKHQRQNTPNDVD